MGLRMPTGGVIGEEERLSQHIYSGPEAESIRAAALQLAARLSWLPERPSGDMFANRCKDLSTALEDLFKKVNVAFAKDTPSEDLIWLKDNTQQLLLAARTLSNELAP